jgi:outer membrane immunogenic protein
MRLGLIGIAAAAAMTLSAPVAMAADIPAPAYKAPVMAPPPFSWTGFYLGVNAGYGWADAAIDAGALGVVTVDSNLNGFVGGGQIGYNWQIGNFVLGLEADIQGTTIGRSDTFFVGAPGVAVTVDRDLNWFATVRGRAGLAFDRVMIYATGGWAYVDYGVDVTVAGLVGASAGSSKSGWTVGGGLEWAFLPNWSVKFEYLYVEIDDVSIFPFALVAPINVEGQLNVIRAGVNYRF